MAKTTASLVGVVALLFADPAACFVPAHPAISFKQGGACSAHVCVDSMRNRATRAGTTTAEGRRRPRHVARRAGPGEPTRMAAEGGGGGGAAATGVERKTVAIEASEGVPRGPEGAIKLTYLEGNSWMCQVNGLNLLVDPVFGVLDFGVPALIQARKRVLWDGDRVTRDLAAVTDFLVITQGFDDHCHPRTVEALAGLLDPSVRVVAPPSAQAVLEEHFPTSRITYILPGQSAVLSAGGRAVEVEAVNGATLGPPWQQAENGYFIRPAASSADGDGIAPEGGTLYLEPHLMFDESELSAFTADVVIAPVVEQNVGPYPLVRGGARALELASTLKASKLVSMANGDGDFTGPVRNAVRQGNTLQEFLDLARDAGRDVVVPEPAKPINVWP